MAGGDAVSSAIACATSPAHGMRDVARALVRLGYAPVPLGREKRPLVRWGAWAVTRPTRDELRAMPWDEALGVAVLTGRPHGLVVVDADDGLAWRWALDSLPAVRGTLTRRGGHLHFRHPEHGIIVSRTGPRAIVIDEDVRLEVKGFSAMATAPGSLHPSGSVYGAWGDWRRPVDELPELPSLIASQAEDRPAPPPPPPPRRRAGDDPVRAIENYLRKVGGLPKEGAGSDVAVFRAAAWAKRNAPELREEEFVGAVRRERPEFAERWVTSKWRSAGRK